MRILIDLNDTTASHARRLAQAVGITRKAWLERTIAQATGTAERELVLGCWQLAGGDVAAACADCGQAIVGPLWVGLTTTHRIIGPLCAHCATTD